MSFINQVEKVQFESKENDIFKNETFGHSLSGV